MVIVFVLSKSILHLQLVTPDDGENVLTALINVLRLFLIAVWVGRYAWFDVSVQHSGGVANKNPAFSKWSAFSSFTSNPKGWSAVRNLSL